MSEGRDTLKYYNMTNTRRIKELWNLFYEAETIVESFSRADYKKIDNGAVYCLTNCIRWGLQGISEMKGVFNDT